jgi:hypothetical protein
MTTSAISDWTIFPQGNFLRGFGAAWPLGVDTGRG